MDGKFGKRQAVRCASAMTAMALAGGMATSAQAESVYDMIVFPQGDISFADSVVAYEPDFGGGKTPTQRTDPLAGLGAPDGSAVSLGSGGRLTLQFTDNALAGSGDGMYDLHIFEIGGLTEATFVEISKDGNTFFDVGRVSGSTDSIDIDSFGFGADDVFHFVRLRDDPDHSQAIGRWVGADIDAVGAISTVPSTPATIAPLPAPAFMGLAMFAGLGAWQAVRRRRNTHLL